MKIALVHDSFTQMGGAERVVDAFHEIYPKAPVFCLVFDVGFKEKYRGWDIQTSLLQIIYNYYSRFQRLLLLIPWAVDSLSFKDYDLVLSSSSGFVKNIRVPKNCVHINYCHTPTRFLWSDQNYIKQEVPWIFRGFVNKFVLPKLKAWDLRGAKRVNYFIANSEEVKKRIKLYYNRDSVVIYPPVDTNFWHPVLYRRHSEGELPELSQVRQGSTTEESQSKSGNEEILRPSAAFGSQDDALDGKRDYFLLAGRLQPHKQNDLIVKIFNELNLPLHVAGTGRQEKYLKSIAKNNITFLGKVSDEKLREEYSGALGFIYPQTEDAGLMPLEAAACGTATLAYGKGGALETVVPGATGEFFYDYDKEKIKQLILNWNVQKYQADQLRSQAEKFSKEKFKQQILGFINSIKNND